MFLPNPPPPPQPPPPHTHTHTRARARVHTHTHTHAHAHTGTDTHTHTHTRTHTHAHTHAHTTHARRHECAQWRARTRSQGDAAVLDSSWVGTRRRCGYRPHARTCSSGLGLSTIAGLPYRSNAHKAYGLGHPTRVPTARIRPCEYPEYLRCPRAPLRVSARPAAQTHATAARGRRTRSAQETRPTLVQRVVASRGEGAYPCPDLLLPALSADCPGLVTLVLPFRALTPIFAR